MTETEKPQAFNLYFGDVPDRPADAREVGWIGTEGPGIAAAQWPRGPLTGLPMLHAFTLELPEAYRRKGADYPAIAFFQGEGQFAEESEPGPSADSEDPFLQDWAQAVEHPMLARREDIIDGQFALIWLTAEEFAAGPSAPPEDTRRLGEHGPEDEGPNAWDTHVDRAPVFIAGREDPNAGLAPNELGEGGYQDMWDESAGAVHGWVDQLGSSDHLGGTSLPVQGMPEGLSPWYVEFNEFGGLNFGGGSAQLDLETETFDWACD
ncbi:hypothetical protein NQ038_12465 [Brevibacterium sp. 50QC2O2]|uniref:hypothetical protein n=1 Tax=Brevibacterium sp. 50QC2O2 TaxID=2968459 RepID=UPI00211C9B2A|nr:hypothetical protein [Brevibacterium sp. 50QC2O2]MCQ9389453.1 hypothetical protein [Brevibacterium sp. 50QC2O2]